MKQRISGMTIKQADIIDTAMKIRPGRSLDDDIRAVPGPSHPIISTHPETGGNMLFLGRRHGSYVNGLSLEESEALLNELWAHATQPRFSYAARVGAWRRRRVGQPRDVAQARSVRSRDAARSLRRAGGGTPAHFEAPDALTRPPHPRAALSAKG